MRSHAAQTRELGDGWSWRLLLVGLVLYLAFRVASVLRLVVLPCVAALLLTALLHPLLSRFRRFGLPSLAATWCTLLIAVAVLAGVGTLAVTRTTADYPHLVNELRHTVTQLQTSLAGPPFHVRHAGIQSLSDRALKYLQQHQSLVAGTVVSGGKIFLEILAGLVLMLFVTFFLLKDGERIWAWLTGFLGPDSRTRVHLADIRMGIPGMPVFFGYIQQPEHGLLLPATALSVTEDVGPHGFPSKVRIDIAGGDSNPEAGSDVMQIGLDVTPVAFGPVLLRNDDGRTSRFPRAMVTCRTDDGRTGAGWIEWNQPDQPDRSDAPSPT